jgi:pimeloyl-ACP methyl ester carboxylesterase
MPIMKVRDAQIEYDEQGNGDLELLPIQGGLVCDAFQPLVSELTLTSSNRFRIVNFHRRGYGGSSRATFPFSIEDQAKDCLAVMDNLDLKRTHIVGHSLSGLIALQLANDVPERISSLTLIEPSLVAFTPSASQGAQALSKVGALYQSGNKVGALDVFMKGSSGQEYRKTMDKVLPAGWYEQAVKDIDTFFQIEFPAIRLWRFNGGGRVKQPVLSIYGTEKRWGNTEASGAEFDQVLRSWFPQTESLPIRGAYHWPHVTKTIEVAKGLTNFVERVR